MFTPGSYLSSMYKFQLFIITYYRTQSHYTIALLDQPQLMCQSLQYMNITPHATILPI